MMRKLNVVVLLTAACVVGALLLASLIVETKVPHPFVADGQATRILWHYAWNVRPFAADENRNRTFNLVWMTFHPGRIQVAYQGQYYGPEEFQMWSKQVPDFFRVARAVKSLSDAAPEPRGQYMESLWNAEVHLWWPFLLLMAYPGEVFFRGPYRRRRRRAKGLCMKCGYNLTGNVSGICPECGTKR